MFAWAWVALMLQGAAGAAEGPPLVFESLASLETWAEASTFGGGRLYPIHAESPPLYCADRAHTSGIPSSELALFREENDGNGDDTAYVLALYLPLKLGVSREVRIVETTLVIEEQAMGADPVEMRVPLSILNER